MALLLKLQYNQKIDYLKKRWGGAAAQKHILQNKIEIERIHHIS